MGGEWYSLEEWFSTGSGFVHISGNTTGCHNQGGIIDIQWAEGKDTPKQL